MPFKEDFTRAINRKVAIGDQMVLSLIGDTGAGKSHTAQQCAKALQEAGIYKNPPLTLDAMNFSFGPYMLQDGRRAEKIAETFAPARDSVVIVDEIDRVDQPGALLELIFKAAKEMNFDLTFTGKSDCVAAFLIENPAWQSRTNLSVLNLGAYRDGANLHIQSIDDGQKIEPLIKDVIASAPARLPNFRLPRP